MNIQELNTTYEGIRTVGCVFRNTKYAEGHERTYTYLVPPEVGILKKGDLAIVEKDGVYSIVTITRIDDQSQVDPNATYRYKWLVSVTSTKHYADIVAAEDKSIHGSVQSRL